MALDPGGTTGWASCELDSKSYEGKITPDLSDFKFNSGHLGPDEHHEDLWRWLVLSNHEYDDVSLELVCESFEFRQHINHGGAKTKVELISKEYIGVIKLFAASRDLKLKFQTASAGKTMFPDKGPQANVKLKQVGVYKPVSTWVHAMDAMRHLLRFMVAEKHIREPLTDKWLKDD
jgi:hypothetical protein